MINLYNIALLLFFITAGILSSYRLFSTHKKTPLDETTLNLVSFISRSTKEITNQIFKVVILAFLILAAVITVAHKLFSDHHTILVSLAVIFGFSASILIAIFLIKGTRQTLINTLYHLKNNRKETEKKLKHSTHLIGWGLTATITACLFFFLTILHTLFQIKNLNLFHHLSWWVPKEFLAQFQTPTDINLFLTHEYTVLLLALCFGIGIFSTFLTLFSAIFSKSSTLLATTLKNEHGLFEDDLRNPAVLSDITGRNVNTGVANSIRLFESTLIVSIFSAIIGILIMNYNFDNLALSSIPGVISLPFWIYCGVNLLAFTVDIFSKLFNTLKRTTSQLMVIYALTPLILLLFFNTGWFYLLTLGSVLSASVIAISLCLIHRNYLCPHASLCKSIISEAETGPIETFLKGLSSGFILGGTALLSTLICAVATWILLPQGMDTGFSILLIMYGLTVVSLCIIAPTAKLLSLGITKSTIDTAKGLSQMLMLDKNIQEQSQKMDLGAAMMSALLKSILISCNFLIAPVVYTLLVFRSSLMSQSISALKTPALIQNAHLLSLLNPNLILGLIFATCFFAVITGSLLMTIQKGCSHLKQSNSDAIINTGHSNTVPDYAFTVKFLIKHAAKYLFILIFTLISTAIFAIFAFKLSGTIGFLIGGLVICTLLCLPLMYAGTLWSFAHARLHHTGSEDAIENKGALLSFLNGIGGVFKDAIAPALPSILKLMGLLILLLAAALRLN